MGQNWLLNHSRHINMKLIDMSSINKEWTDLFRLTQSQNKDTWTHNVDQDLKNCNQMHYILEKLGLLMPFWILSKDKHSCNVLCWSNTWLGDTLIVLDSFAYHRRLTLADSQHCWCWWILRNGNCRIINNWNKWAHLTYCGDKALKSSSKHLVSSKQSRNR